MAVEETKEVKTPTDAELKASAKKIAERFKVQEVYVNSKGEFFTVKCNAENSEKDKTKVKTFTFK